MARRVAGSGGGHDVDAVARLHRNLADAVPASAELVAEVSGIPEPTPAPWGLIDRATWAEVNIVGMQELLGPLSTNVAERMRGVPWPVRVAQRSVVSLEIGILLGYISRRVLGQYDLLMPGPDRRRRSSTSGVNPSADGALYFVGPNLLELEHRLRLVPHEFTLWVAVHEMTHRFQFAGVPWLRTRFLELVHSYLNSVDLDARGLAQRIKGAVSRLASRDTPVEERNPVYLFASPEQRELLDQLQALMAVVEGHGNYVMDAVGARAIPSYQRMRSLFEGRRRQTRAIQRAFNHLIGLEMKLRQYELGQHFCEEVVSAGGAHALMGMWEDASNLPTLTELREPRLWLKRVA